MPNISLDFRAVQYVTDLGITVWAMRAFVDVEPVIVHDRQILRPPHCSVKPVAAC